ncbi:UNVERIFIED_CONTAM: hypothetical protein Slati_3505300 [Sesamum latifolium]|uniref:Reverse transcriptase zinc-binding domain-containing protein n=1 Tax=Sesamum latifolium TaxID=2727402 RepID=A0AAW2UIA8_9LAMI
MKKVRSFRGGRKYSWVFLRYDFQAYREQFLAYGNPPVGEETSFLNLEAALEDDPNAFTDPPVPTTETPMLIKKPLVLCCSMRSGAYPGVSICRGALSISHLLFANDTLIFNGASLTISRAILENMMELYLGFPSKVARSKRELFSVIKDRVWYRISGWNEKLLSQAGKEVLIKSIIQAIPPYAMGYFWLPTMLLSEIHRMIATFWWCNRGCHKIHLLSRDSIFGRLILFHVEEFDSGFAVVPFCLSVASRYGDLINSSFGEWNRRKIDKLVWLEDPDLILGIPLNQLGADDTWVWYYAPSGLFTVRSAYHLACSLAGQPGPSDLFASEQAWGIFYGRLRFLAR